MALLVKVNGQVDDVEPENGTNFRIEEVRELIGGHRQNTMIQMVNIAGPLPEYGITEKKLIMLMDEEGRLNNLPPNELATMIWKHDFIVGNVLICANKQFK